MTPSVVSGPPPWGGIGTFVTVTVQLDYPLLTGGFLRLFAPFNNGTLTIYRDASTYFPTPNCS